MDLFTILIQMISCFNKSILLLQLYHLFNLLQGEVPKISLSINVRLKNHDQCIKYIVNAKENFLNSDHVFLNNSHFIKVQIKVGSHDDH